MSRRWILSAAVCLLVLGPLTEAPAQPKVGDVVWVQWRPNDWKPGKVSKQGQVGWRVALENGEEADVAATLLAPDTAPKKGDVKVGSRTLALWDNGQFYPGTVTAAGAGGFDIQFDDGDQATVKLADLRLIPAKAAAGLTPKAGDKVWAQWRPNDWYPGKVTKATEVGLHVQFDDGDEADLPPSLVAPDKAPQKNEAKAGTRVLALWTDDKFYPGTVTKVADDKFDIKFDDGDERTVGVEDLRLLNE
jgi:hypothetical protein